jgi:hypothetical protein
MILQPSYIVTYPQFSYYVRYNIPKLVSVPKIVANVAKYGNLTLSEFKQAVTWGKGPNIIITDLHHGQCGVPKAYGCFRHTKPKNIEIHLDVIKDFEKATKNHKDKNTTGQYVYVVGATLLHELCHWGNHNNVPKIPELIEMGAEFEKYTYGKVIY